MCDNVTQKLAPELIRGLTIQLNSIIVGFNLKQADFIALNSIKLQKEITIDKN